MNDLAASIGIAQLKRLPQMNKRRGEIITRYLEGIKNLKTIKTLLTYESDKYFYQMIRIRSENKENLILYLKSKGIATGCHYTPLTMQPLFKPYANHCPIVETEYYKMITLPLHVDLTDDDVEYVVEYITNFDKNSV